MTVSIKQEVVGSNANNHHFSANWLLFFIL